MSDHVHASASHRSLRRTWWGSSKADLGGRTSRTRRNFTGESFWARGYFVSTVGLDEEMVRKYIRDQEKEDQRLDPLVPLVAKAPFRGLMNSPFEGLL